MITIIAAHERPYNIPSLSVLLLLLLVNTGALLKYNFNSGAPIKIYTQDSNLAYSTRKLMITLELSFC